MDEALTILAVPILALAVSCVVVPAAVWIGRRRRWVNGTGGPGSDAPDVPRTGGLAVAGGLAAGCLAAHRLGVFPVSAAVLSFAAAAAAVCAIGLLDDVRGCSIRARLFWQSAAASVVVGAGYALGGVDTPFGPVAAGDGPLLVLAGAMVAVGWLVGVTNAVNFLDGLDGLAGGLAGIMAAGLAVIAALQGDAASTAVALALFGACAGFLPWNWKPARVFLGDAGSLTTGFVLAWLALNVQTSAGAAGPVALLVLGLPVFDALLVMRERYREAPDRPWLARVRRVFQGDHRHVHHVLLAAASHRTAVLTLYGVAALSCGAAIVAVHRGDAYLALAAAAMQIALLVLARNVRRYRVKRALAADARDEAVRAGVVLER